MDRVVAERGGRDVNAVERALVHLESVAKTDPGQVIPAAVAVVDALAGPREEGVSTLDAFDRIVLAVGPADFGGALLDAMFRAPYPESFLGLARSYVTAPQLEEAVITALGRDDDTAAGALMMQYDAWGHGAWRLTPDGARRVVAAAAALRARRRKSPRLELALSTWEAPSPRE